MFSLSLGDWLDDEVPIEWLADMLDVIRRCPNLDFLLLTKRPEKWRDRIASAMVWLDRSIPRMSLEFETQILAAIAQQKELPEYAIYKRSSTSLWCGDWLEGHAPENIWIGTTVEDQKRSDERIPHLLKIPAKVRFLSCEPLLESVDLKAAFADRCAVGGPVGTDAACGDCDPCLGGRKIQDAISWLIVGGESGHHARPFNVDWARSIIAQCKATGVACFVKQLGAIVKDRNDAGFESQMKPKPVETLAGAK